MTGRDVVFESRVGDHWEPVPSSKLQVGDVVRMRDVRSNEVYEEGRVSKVGGTDPDTSRRADLFIEAVGG